jgi:general stress protein YciG
MAVLMNLNILTSIKEVTMANNSQRGGSSEQHAKAGRQSQGGQNAGGNRGGNSRQEAARKGGEAVSRDREHMSDIGRKGGEAVSRDREHMSDIGRKGGQR